jgi:hexosaminidase
MPRSQQVSAMAFATVDAEQLQTCSKEGLVLRLEDDEPVGDQRAVVPVDLGNPCWIWKGVDLTGVTSLRVHAVDLPFNFQFGADPTPGELRKQATREGELEVALDGCEGKRVGTAMLGDAQRGRARRAGRQDHRAP